MKIDAIAILFEISQRAMCKNKVLTGLKKLEVKKMRTSRIVGSIYFNSISQFRISKYYTKTLDKDKIKHKTEEERLGKGR